MVSLEKSSVTVQRRLIDVSLRLLESDGLEALQARRIASEVGVSTMAVYTHFGGMPALIDEIVRDGFLRFGRGLGDVPQSDDSVADLLAIGLAYRQFARDNPELYRLMFGLTGPASRKSPVSDLTVESAPTTLTEGLIAFQHLIDVVGRATESGRIRRQDPIGVAGQLWSIMHGYVLLEITGFFGGDDHGLAQVLGPLTMNLLVGLGDSRDATERSMSAVAQRLT